MWTCTYIYIYNIIREKLQHNTNTNREVLNPAEGVHFAPVQYSDYYVANCQINKQMERKYWYEIKLFHNKKKNSDIRDKEMTLEQLSNKSVVWNNNQLHNLDNITKIPAINCNKIITININIMNININTHAFLAV